MAHAPIGLGGSKAGQRMFSSDMQATVVVNSTLSDVSLPDVVIPAGALSGKSIERVVVAVSFRKSVESSALANAVNGASQAIQVRDDTPGTYVDAIDIVDNSFAHDADETGPGFMLVGDTDVKATVDGEDTYEFQWDDADVDGDSITFHDWQCHLIVYFK